MEENNEKIRAWRKTRRGLVTNIYDKITRRGRVVDFDLEYLHEFAKCKKFERLYADWIASGYKRNLRPCVDRMNAKKGYLKTNIQWLSVRDNNLKGVMEKKIGKKYKKVLQIKDGVVINSFRTQAQAGLHVGLRQADISIAISGNNRTAAGFQWKYSDEWFFFTGKPIENATQINYGNVKENL